MFSRDLSAVKIQARCFSQQFILYVQIGWGVNLGSVDYGPTFGGCWLAESVIETEQTVERTVSAIGKNANNGFIVRSF